MLRIFILLTFLSLSILYSRVYYISTDGKSSSSCQSKTSACSLEHFLSFVPTIKAGDTILFKRNQHFFLTDRRRLKFRNIIATQKNPVLIDAYGEGKKPILDGKITIHPKWENEKSNLWCTSLKNQPARLWINNREQKRGAMNQLSNTISWQWESSHLCIYRTTPPDRVVVNGAPYPLLIINSAYINIRNLDLQGGASASIKIKKSNHISIKNSIIGKDSGYGVSVDDTKYLTIINNLIDANFTLYYLKRFSKVPRGANDGIFLGKNTRFSTILFNEFKNWGHSGVGASTKAPNEIAHNRVSFNYFSTKDISYGRAFGYSGNVHHNRITYNYIKDTSTQNQLNGHDNYFAYNLIDTVSDTPLKRGQQGNGISLEDYLGDTYNNEIVHNIIQNTEGAAVAFIALGDKSKYSIMNNKINNNIFINCGKKSRRYRTLYLPSYKDVKEQYIQNNLFINNQTEPIAYHKQALTVEEFNSRTDSKIRGNREEHISYEMEQRVEQRRSTILNFISFYKRFFNNTYQ